MKILISIFIAGCVAFGPALSAEFLKPGQGEPVLTGGEKYPIKWDGASGPVSFELTTDGGATWKALAVVPGEESYWEAPRVNTRSAALRMLSKATGEELARTGDLRILAGKLKFLAPVYGEALRGGSESIVRWDCVFAEPFELSISLDGGYAWEKLAAVEEPLRGYTRVRWPNAFTYKARLRASLPDAPDMEYDRTDDFSLQPLSFALDSENTEKNIIGAAYPWIATNDVSFGVVCEKENEKLTATITNERGDQLISKSFDLIKGANTVGFDIRELAIGAYFVAFELNGKIETRKFLKE